MNLISEINQLCIKTTEGCDWKTKYTQNVKEPNVRLFNDYFIISVFRGCRGGRGFSSQLRSKFDGTSERHFSQMSQLHMRL
jgi:hypothetical protein